MVSSENKDTRQSTLEDNAPVSLMKGNVMKEGGNACNEEEEHRKVAIKRSVASLAVFL